MEIKKKLQNCDYILVLSVFALAIFGIIIIGSATRININGPQSEYISQMIWFVTGIFLMIIAALINYENLCKFYIFIYIFNIIILILVLLIGTGNNDGNVRRWLFGLQPSEFAKIFMIIYIAKFIDKFREKINNISILCLLCIATAIPAILIKIQPSLSASLVLMAILVTELFIGKISFKYIKIVLLIIIPVAIIFYLDLISENHRILSLFLNEYQIDRILPLVNPDLASSNYYQTKNSIWAIGSGQLRGKGLYNGTINQLSYLPYSHNDFIFSVVGEEFGFLGCLGVLAVMFVIISRCIKISLASEDNLGALVAGGVAGMLCFQTFVNVGVATGILPNTGMPFPFMSYGGSAMWVDMICIGIVLSKKKKKPKSMF